MVLLCDCLFVSGLRFPKVCDLSEPVGHCPSIIWYLSSSNCLVHRRPGAEVYNEGDDPEEGILMCPGELSLHRQLVLVSLVGLRSSLFEVYLMSLFGADMIAMSQ